MNIPGLGAQMSRASVEKLLPMRRQCETPEARQYPIKMPTWPCCARNAQSRQHMHGGWWMSMHPSLNVPAQGVLEEVLIYIHSISHKPPWHCVEQCLDLELWGGYVQLWGGQWAQGQWWCLLGDCFLPPTSQCVHWSKWVEETDS